MEFYWEKKTHFWNEILVQKRRLEVPQIESLLICFPATSQHRICFWNFYCFFAFLSKFIPLLPFSSEIFAFPFLLQGTYLCMLFCLPIFSSLFHAILFFFTWFVHGYLYFDFTRLLLLFYCHFPFLFTFSIKSLLSLYFKAQKGRSWRGLGWAHTHTNIYNIHYIYLHCTIVDLNGIAIEMRPLRNLNQTDLGRCLYNLLWAGQMAGGCSQAAGSRLREKSDVLDEPGMILAQKNHLEADMIDWSKSKKRCGVARDSLRSNARSNCLHAKNTRVESRSLEI